MWDPRNLEAPSLRMVPEPGQARKQCWTVCQSQHTSDNSQQHFVAAGFDNGDIKVFDAYKISFLCFISDTMTICPIYQGF